MCLEKILIYVKSYSIFVRNANGKLLIQSENVTLFKLTMIK